MRGKFITRHKIRFKALPNVIFVALTLDFLQEAASVRNIEIITPGGEFHGKYFTRNVFQARYAGFDLHWLVYAEEK